MRKLDEKMKSLYLILTRKRESVRAFFFWKLRDKELKKLGIGKRKRKKKKNEKRTKVT